jgi:hypothetical protein
VDDIFPQLCAGASNELYANPRDCRKYFKCESSGASLQSCPANLIFDTKLKERSSKPAEESDATGVTNELDNGMDQNLVFDQREFGNRPTQTYLTGWMMHTVKWNLRHGANTCLQTLCSLFFDRNHIGFILYIL